MSITCGIDIVKVSRIKESIEKIGEDFKKRIYTDEEINYCESRRMCKFKSYAARFAAKEAVYKAISPEISKEAMWRDIEILKRENGKPYIILHGEIKNIAEGKNIKDIDISLSHDNDYAVASVVLLETTS